MKSLPKTGLPQEDLVNYLSSELSMEAVDFSQVNPTEEIIGLLTPELARKFEVLPLGMTGAEIELAVGDPLDFLENGQAALEFELKKSINPKVAYRGAVLEAIDQAYGAAEDRKMNDFFEGMSEDEIEIGDGVRPEDVSEEDAPIMARSFCDQGCLGSEGFRHSHGALGEKIPYPFQGGRQIAGTTRSPQTPPTFHYFPHQAYGERSLAEKRVPLDGRINVKVGEKVIDLRVSTLPTVHGESIVMRILDKESLSSGLPQLGFFSDDQETFERVISMPDGIFLVTGPTGSGKSTTLYSALNAINKPDRKIITVEDPVEYEVAGINQVQVRADVGMTFSAALRAMLRQAPNIVMVGEIRDLETAEIAINASLTGHMVFSTLHTNDAPSAVSRLIDMGVKPFLVSASLRAALAQRLVRSICQNCKKPYEANPSELAVLGVSEDQAGSANFMQGTGCEKCGDKGFRGRKGVFEIFGVNEEIEEMIYHNVSIVELRKKAREMGMRSMREDGFRKVLAGITTLDEVLMVTTAEE